VRIGFLLIALWLTVAPAMAHGSRGYVRSYSSHSYRSYSYHPRSSRSSSGRRSSGLRYRSYSTHSSSRSRGMSSYRAPRSSHYAFAQRGSHGKIERSEGAKDAFKRQQPCPSTGRSRGACPGYVIDHVRPLATGGADAPSNMQWQTKADAKAKDKWERK
jgi:hypothetical protein